MKAPITIPDFEWRGELGRGGMSCVYLAHDLNLDRDVAIKVVRPPNGSDPAAKAEAEAVGKMLQEEGRRIGQLSHNHIIKVHACGMLQQHFYMIMAYLPGGDLAKRIREGMSPEAAVKVMLQIGSALQYAHAKSILHRDVKPLNVMFDENDDAVLVDFGIAKREDTQSLATQMGLTVGTMAYMSPERARGDQGDRRSDLYAMGVMFYEMLTKIPVFKGITEMATYAMGKIALPPLPPGLEQYQPIVEKLLQKDPEQRYPSAQAMLDDIHALRPATLVIGPRPPPVPRETRPPNPEPDSASTSVLPRGANTNLSKQAPGLKSVRIGLGWSAQASSGTEFDLDASAFLLKKEKVRSDQDFIFYSNLVSVDGSVKHQGDHTSSNGAAEEIHVDLSKVPLDVDKVVFTVTIHEGENRRQSFGQVRDAFIRVFNGADNQELARYNLSAGDVSNETAMIFGELYRAAAEWKFRAVGQGFKGGLRQLARHFGVDVV